MATSHSARPRGPSIMHAVLAGLLMLMIGLLAMRAKQPPPPAVAEFAPQAVDQIDEAPTEQTSAFGSGDGGECVGDDCPGAVAPRETGPLPTPREIPARPGLRCFGDPPRQTEDPQSPPCTVWDDPGGDNGGATARGVTSTEVRLFSPNVNVGPRIRDPLIAFFNKRFEFYGRQLTLVQSETNDLEDPNHQRNVARRAIEEQVFASTYYKDGGGWHFHDELSLGGVVSATGFESIPGRDYLADRSPFLWSYSMDSDRMLGTIGDWVCHRLAGHNAAHGGAGMPTQQRVFGIVFAPWAAEDDPTSLEPLQRELDACGEQVPSNRIVRDVPQTAGGANNTMLQLSNEGVTSVICLCNYYFLHDLMAAAQTQLYLPEWLVSSFGNQDHNKTLKESKQTPPPQQLQNTLGLTFRPRLLRLEDEPYWRGVREMDPNAQPTWNGAPIDAMEAWRSANWYRSLLVVASGIQMAGPNLTPETFMRGLHRTTFPNPDHPNMAGRVGFRPEGFAMTLDAAEFWFSTNARSPYPADPPGSICYVDGGERRAKGDWPGEDPFFRGPCDSGT